MKSKTAILLLNLGTPDSPSRWHVGRYLSEFLNDPRVIDIPWLARKILVNCIIVPFRSGNSSKLYQAIWDKESGSPLLMNTLALQKKLQLAVGDDITVEMAMRYKNPSMDVVLERYAPAGLS